LIVPVFVEIFGELERRRARTRVRLGEG